jgi:hypothetical protein
MRKKVECIDLMNVARSLKDEKPIGTFGIQHKAKSRAELRRGADRSL